MKHTALTPVERGVLLTLMANSQPVRQAGFKKDHGLSVRKCHRHKLEQLGLIDVSGNRLAFSLTEQGRILLKQELSAPRPDGMLGLGPLYPALNALSRLAKRPDIPPEAAFGPDKANGNTSPADNGLAWSEVDEPLARALQDISVFAASVIRFKETAKSSFEKEIKRIEVSANLVFQSLRLAAAKRRLDLDGQVGSETAYDPVLFHSDDLVKAGEPVRIRKSAVTRGHGKAKVIVQQGLAEALHHSK